MTASANSDILFIAGTRPEIIKMAPVVALAREKLDRAYWLLTGQHKSLAHNVLDDFGVPIDEELQVLKAGSTLGQLSVRLMQSLEEALDRYQPRVVVVQGDTTTAMLAGLAAFSRQIPVAHIEAGLRSNDLAHPYPEEANRKIVAVFAALHFAPTARAKNNLLREGVPAMKIVTSGNTVVDALAMISGRLQQAEKSTGKQILVTLHRRESWDGGIAEACSAIKRLALSGNEFNFIFPVHKNPHVQDQVRSILGGFDNIRLTAPMSYLQLQSTLSRCWLVLTDSGGIQEEAPSYQVPVLILRDVTERPEAVERGQARVIGTDGEAIFATCMELLHNPKRYLAMQQGANPFGDGLASQRIVQALDLLLQGRLGELNSIDPFI